MYHDTNSSMWVEMRLRGWGYGSAAGAGRQADWININEMLTGCAMIAKGRQIANPTQMCDVVTFACDWMEEQRLRMKDGYVQRVAPPKPCEACGRAGE